MFLQIKGFTPTTTTNVASGKDEPSEDLQFSFYFSADSYSAAEFKIDRESFEQILGAKVSLLDTFPITDTVCECSHYELLNHRKDHKRECLVEILDSDGKLLMPCPCIGFKAKG